MSQQTSPEDRSDAEWRKQLRLLQAVPAPNLARGRARVMAAQGRRAIKPIPRRVSFALAFAIGAAVILMMGVMSNAFGVVPVATAAMTRTDTSEASNVMPFSEPTPVPNQYITDVSRMTPAPDIVPEPPRVTLSPARQTLLP